MNKTIPEETRQMFLSANQDQNNAYFMVACQKGSLEEVKYLLKSEELEYKANIYYKNGQALASACLNKHKDIIEYLTSSPQLDEHISLEDKSEEIVVWLGLLKDNEFKKYLLNSRNLKTHLNIHTNNDSLLRTACYEGDIEHVKYLLTSEQLKEKANINCALTDATVGQQIIATALNSAYFSKSKNELLEYLFSFDNLDVNVHNGIFLTTLCEHEDSEMFEKVLKIFPKEKIDIHINKDIIFKTALITCSEIAKSLVFDYDIKYTTEIENYLKYECSRALISEEVREMFINYFSSRELQKELEKELDKKLTNNKKSKV